MKVLADSSAAARGNKKLGGGGALTSAHGSECDDGWLESARASNDGTDGVVHQVVWGCPFCRKIGGVFSFGFFSREDEHFAV